MGHHSLCTTSEGVFLKFKVSKSELYRKLKKNVVLLDQIRLNINFFVNLGCPL
jgi:hypothetical protein